MNTKSPCALALLCLLSVGLAIPAYIHALPQGGEQRAGEISKVIPTANLARGARSLPAEAKTVVDWNDLVKTQSTWDRIPRFTLCSTTPTGSKRIWKWNSAESVRRPRNF